MAHSLLEHARRAPLDEDEPELVAVPREQIKAVVSAAPAPIQIVPSTAPSSSTPPSSSSPPTPPSPPDHPAESVPVAPLPRSARAWQRIEPFTAGVKGPVTLPLSKDLPACPPGHVLIPSSSVQLLTPRGSLPREASARAFLARKTAEELRTGAVEYATFDNVQIILPMFVVENADGKQRVIFDGRALNAFLRDAAGSVSYESVRDALMHTARVGTKIDIASAFRHVLVDIDQRGLLGFTVEGRLFRYRTLPFGVSWSPALFVAALRPVVDRLRAAGVRLVWYVDDMLILADTVDQLDAALERVLRELAAHGWTASPEKTFCHAYSALPFLGLHVRLDGGMVRIGILDKSRCKIRRDVEVMLADGDAPLHTLQKVTGRLNFLRIVLPEVGFSRTALDRAVSWITRSARRAAPVVGGLRQQLTAIHDLLSPSVLDRQVSADSDVGGERVHVYSDASATGWGVLRVDPNGPFRVPPALIGAEFPVDQPIAGWTATEVFSDTELTMSSAAREILAVVKGIVALDLRDCVIMWHSDATAAVGAIRRWASPSPGMAAVLSLLWREVTSRRLRIHVVHVYRDLALMPAADWLSRVGWREAQAEWALSAADVAAVCTALRFHPDGDLFASRANRRFPVFCSRFLEEGSVGDAFYTPWPGRAWWAFPPWSQRSRFLSRLLDYAIESQVEEVVSSLFVSSSSSHQSSTLSVVLVTRPICPGDPDSSIWARLRPYVLRSIWIAVPPEPSFRRIRPLISSLRLLGDDGAPALRAPRFALVAHLIRITGLRRDDDG